MSRHYLMIVSALLLLTPSVTRAENVLLWGIQDGCEALPEMDKIVARHLRKVGIEADLLFAKPSSCVGEACGKQVRKQCGASRQSGKLVGGRIYRTASRTTSRFRLWLHDLGSGQTAYSDTYCQDCNLIYSLPAQVEALLHTPRFSTGFSTTPLYCQADVSAASAPRIPISRYIVSVTGDAKLSKAVLTGLKPMMRQTLIATEFDKTLRGTDPVELRRAVGERRDAQILTVDVQREGGALLSLYDGPSDKSQSTEIDCKGCEADDLLRKLDSALTLLLATCFDGPCQTGQSKPYPKEACEPLPEVTCGDVTLGNEASADALAAYGPLHPKTATLIKALTWTAFGISAGTAIGLAVANPLLAQEINGRLVNNTLVRPAWTMATASALLLGLSIPLTVVTNRAAQSNPRTENNTATLQCPN